MNSNCREVLKSVCSFFLVNASKIYKVDKKADILGTEYLTVLHDPQGLVPRAF